jgi:hypothetical protein
MENTEMEKAESVIFEVKRGVSKEVQDAVDAVPKEMKAIDNSFESMGVAPGDSLSTLTVLGEEYEAASSMIRRAFLSRDMDSRYPNFAATNTVEELLIAGLEWILAKELDGKSLRDCTPTEMYRALQKHMLRTDGEIPRFTGKDVSELTKAEKKEMLSMFAAEAFDDIYELEVFY